jgi:hypothetical protein
MDSTQKEAQIRLYMEKLKKEEEDKTKVRLSQEQQLLQDEAQKALEKEIMVASKQRIFNDKMRQYIKDRNWLKIVELLNETVFESGAKRVVTNDDRHYTKTNERVAMIISEELKDNQFWDPNTYRSIVFNKERGIHDIYEHSSYKVYQDYSATTYKGLKTFEDVLKDLINFRSSYMGGIFYETLYELRDIIVNFLRRKLGYYISY